MSPERWQKIEAAFQDAMDLDASEREAFLAAHFPDDDALRNEVRKLILSSDSASDFIESPVWTDSAFLDTSVKKEISNSLDNGSSTAGTDSMLGRRVGVYRLTKEIGRGGMGAVYKAERDDGEFQQTVAIKLIKRGMDSDFIVRRFRHERQILASFEHAFIARLLDGGTTEEGVPYFVMEYIEGETLYNYCDKRRLDLRDRLKIFQKVCSAIDYAHSRQIIHRDIKPSNILIRNGSPKLLDFGIAKILDPNLIHESLNPTASMLRMMTPDYASPEQVQGADVKPSSDIYSLGVLLYELLTGHRPYSFAGRALHEVTQVICEVMPELPSRVVTSHSGLLPQYGSDPGAVLAVRQTDVGSLSTQLSAGLDNIIMRAVNKQPQDRYGSAAELSRDISRYLRGEKVLAPRYERANRIAADPMLQAPENSRALAVLPFKFLNLVSMDDTDDRFLGLALADALITRLSKVRRFVVRPTSAILSFGEEVLVDPVKAGRILNVDYILDGSIKKARDRMRVSVQLLNVKENAAIWATSIDESLSDVFTLEDTLANKVIEVLLPRLTGSELEQFGSRGTESPDAFEHYLRGRYHFNSFTEEGFAKAFVSFHSAIAADEGYAHAYAGIADYYNWLGILGVLHPRECFLPAVEAAGKAVELDDNLSEAHASLGFSVHAGKYEWARAEHHLRRAIELNAGNASAYVWYSIVLFTEGRFDEGLRYAERGVELDPLTPFNHHNVGWGLYFARRFEESAMRYERVVRDFPSYSFGHYGLSKVHRITGETSRALEEIEKTKALMGEDSVFASLAEAESLAANGNRAEARKLISQLESLSATRFVSPYQLALAYRFLGDEASAFRKLEDALQQSDAWLNWLGAEPAWDPLRQDARFLNVLERVGYRQFYDPGFDASATRLQDDRPRRRLHDMTTLVIEGDHTDDGTGRKKRPLRPVWAAGMVLILFFLVGAVGWWFGRPGANATPSTAAARFQNPSIVILPFAGEGPDADLGIGLADTLTNKLGNIKDLQVISAATGRALAGLSPEEIGRVHDIAVVLRGSIGRSDAGQVLSAELVDARGGGVLWQEQFKGSEGGLFELQTMLARRTWEALGIDPLPLERQQVERSYTRDPRAYQAYLLGRFELTGRSPDKIRSAISTFEEAVAADEAFAPAYVGLADAYSLLNLYSLAPPPDAYVKARENVERALAIDPNLADAHASMGYIKFYSERDRPAAELEFRRAIQVNPSYAQAHHWFAIVLAAMGRSVEAMQEAQTARRLDPASPAVTAAMAMVAFFANDTDAAVRLCDEALSVNPDLLPALRVKRWALTAANDRQAAAAALEREVAVGGGDADDAGWKITAIEVADPTDKKRLRRELEQAIADPSIRGNDRAFAYEIALAWNNLGETSAALDWLERAASAGSHNFNFLEVDPRLAGLRREPRFIALLRLLRRN